jgi:hypothetical protein
MLNHPVYKEFLNKANKPSLISVIFIYTEELADVTIMLQFIMLLSQFPLAHPLI